MLSKENNKTDSWCTKGMMGSSVILLHMYSEVYAQTDLFIYKGCMWASGKDKDMSVNLYSNPVSILSWQSISQDLTLSF